MIDGDSTVIHSMNRNKEGFAVDLKDPFVLQTFQSLIARADVLIEIFQPGTMDRLGLGYTDARLLLWRQFGWHSRHIWIN